MRHVASEDFAPDERSDVLHCLDMPHGYGSASGKAPKGPGRARRCPRDGAHAQDFRQGEPAIRERCHQGDNAVAPGTSPQYAFAASLITLGLTLCMVLP